MTRRLMLPAVAATALAAALLPSAALAHGRDHNHDRIPDGWERAHHLSLDRNQARLDQDHDGLANRAEYRDHTNPRSADTDEDGLPDGAEVEVGDDPTEADSNHDGVEDGQEDAGTVAGFDGTTLTLTLAAGGTASGVVDTSTHLVCQGGASAHFSEDGRGDGEHGHAAFCGADVLQPGAVVRRAKLETEDGQAVWHVVQLARKS